MHSSRIKLYRLQRGLSRKEVAAKTGISLAMLTLFEDGKRTPDNKTARILASVLGITYPQLMKFVPSERKYQHGEFRKQSTLSKSAQGYLQMLIEEYFDRLFLVADLLGGKVLRASPAMHSLVTDNSPEADAMALRDYWGFARSGPILSLIDVLENKGILICKIPYQHTDFSGINGMADRHPYIAINSYATPERQRSTLIHELVHVSFEQPAQTSREYEKYIEAVSGAFLLPKPDAFAELGRKRRAVSSDMSEETRLLEQLVLRALSEEKISMSRAAELLDVPYHIMRDKFELWN